MQLLFVNRSASALCQEIGDKSTAGLLFMDIEILKKYDNIIRIF